MVRAPRVTTTESTSRKSYTARAVPGRAISTLTPRRGGAPTPVLSPARCSAAVRMGCGGTARPPEAKWSSGVAAFWGVCYNQDTFKDPKKRHDHLSVLYNKDIFWGIAPASSNSPFLVQVLVFPSKPLIALLDYAGRGVVMYVGRAVCPHVRTRPTRPERCIKVIPKRNPQNQKSKEH